MRDRRQPKPCVIDTDIFPNARLTVEQIAKRLQIGRPAVYAMLEQGVLPGIRIGRRWLITRHAYEAWERTCGTANRPENGLGLPAPPEVGFM
jgi:excisionase family DNA binding protein